MNVLMTVILVVQMLSALAMIGLVLVQHGKGCLLYTSDAADD